MKTIFNIYKVLVIIEQNENSQNANKFQASRSAQFILGRNDKNQHL
jgi:hypothetical protein